MIKHLCPCCGKHCYLDSPQCERGEEYTKTGVIPPHKPHGHGGHGGKGHMKPNPRRKLMHSMDKPGKFMWIIQNLADAIRNADADLTDKDKALILLGRVDGISVSDISAMSGAGTDAVEELRSCNYAMTQTDGEGNENIILTEEGKTAAQELIAKQSEKYSELLSCLREEDRDDMLMYLEKLNAGINMKKH